MTDKTNFNAISLFSGLGGDSLGITQAGCTIIAYNELKPTFCSSHNANMPHSELICDGKVNDISKLKDECFVKYLGKTLCSQDSRVRDLALRVKKKMMTLEIRCFWSF